MDAQVLHLARGGSTVTERSVVDRTVSGARSFVDFLRSRGETVVELSGVQWMKYRGALIPAATMPVYTTVSSVEAVRALWRTRALFLRHSTARASTRTEWWHMVCRQYDFQATSANTRSKIRRGLKRLDVRRSTPAWLAEYGYDCHVRSYARYRDASPESREQFQEFLYSLEGETVFDVWTCSMAGELVGYILCLRENDGVFLYTIDITPAGLRAYAAYAMIHLVLEHYVCHGGLPASNGCRSIAHATEMQDFLLKLGFEREYCDLRVIYHPVVRWIVRALYPFRDIVRRSSTVPLMHKVSSVLYQEELVRWQKAGAA